MSRSQRDREHEAGSARRRRPGSAARAAAAGLALAVGGCTGATPAPRPPPSAAPDTAFSAQRAWAHLEALADIGPRPTGSEGAERARTYISAELERLGLTVDEQKNTAERKDAEPVSFVNLLATVPGESADLFLLASAYDTRRVESAGYVGANESAAGPAVMLELARVLVLQPLPYTVRLAFLDGEHVADERGDDAHYGSKALASGLDQRDLLKRVRLAVFFDRVGDADLRLSRDLNSQREYRETFWRVAARLGDGAAFPADEDFEAPDGAHRAFLDHQMRRVVVLVDDRFGGDEPPGAYWRTDQDDLEHVSADSLGTVGTVSLASLGEIATRLRKIDRFAKYPVEEQSAAPAAGGAAAGAKPTEEAGASAPEPEAGPEAPPAPTGSTSEAAPAASPTPPSSPTTPATSGAPATGGTAPSDAPAPDAPGP